MFVTLKLLHYNSYIKYRWRQNNNFHHSPKNWELFSAVFSASVLNDCVSSYKVFCSLKLLPEILSCVIFLRIVYYKGFYHPKYTTNSDQCSLSTEVEQLNSINPTDFNEIPVPDSTTSDSDSSESSSGKDVKNPHITSFNCFSFPVYCCILWAIYRLFRCPNFALKTLNTFYGLFTGYFGALTSPWRH